MLDLLLAVSLHGYRSQLLEHDHTSLDTNGLKTTTWRRIVRYFGLYQRAA